MRIQHELRFSNNKLKVKDLNPISDAYQSNGAPESINRKMINKGYGLVMGSVTKLPPLNDSMTRSNKF